MQIVKPLWIISFLGCFAVIVLTYANLDVFVNIGDITTEGFRLSRDNYFYLSVALLLLLNVILNIAGKAIQFAPKEGIIIPNKKQWLTDINTAKELFFLVKSWTRGLALILNLFLSVLFGIIYNQNSQGNFVLSWTLYLILGLIVFWFVYFFVLFLSTPTHLKKEFSR